MMSGNTPAGSTPSQATPSMNSGMPGNHGSSKRLLTIVASVVAVGLVAAGGVFGYTKFFSPSPEEVMRAMNEKMMAVKSYAYSGTIAVEGQIPNPLAALSGGMGEEEKTVPTSIIEVEFSGQTDLSEEMKDAGSVKVTMRPKDDPDNRMTIGLDVRQIKEATYLKLNQIPTLGLFDAFVAPIKGQWIKLDVAELKKQADPFATEDAATGEKKEQFTLEQIREIQQRVISSNVVKVDKKLSGGSMHHYALVVDKQAIPGLMDDIAKLFGEKPATESDLVSFREQLDHVTISTAEIWIGRKDSLPYKIQFGGDYADEKSGLKLQMTMVMEFKDYDKPVTIEAPTDAKTFEELFGGMMGGSGLGGDVEDDSFKFSPTSADDADLFLSNNDETDTDADGLYDREEKLMKTDPAKADTDGDGFNDYEEIVSGHDPLKKQ